MTLNQWIEREFTGYGVAVRTQSEPAIPGEPFMSMAVAKDLTRRAVAEFAVISRAPAQCAPGLDGVSMAIEACAKIADQHWEQNDQLSKSPGWDSACIQIARAIRALSVTSTDDRQQDLTAKPAAPAAADLNRRCDRPAGRQVEV